MRWGVEGYKNEVFERGDNMKIIDTASLFVRDYEPTIAYLDNFYARHADEYAHYFERHCLNSEEKKKKAIHKHPEKLQDILPMRDLFFEEIPRITRAYEEMFPVTFTKDVHLFVGLYVSNAFTYRQCNPEVGFCLEKLPYNRKHIQLITAHEFGHATHHIYNDAHETDWEKVDWLSPLTWLLQEGIATYLSMQLVEADFDEYFAYEEDKEWIQFVLENEVQIAKRLFDDIKSGMDPGRLMKEWFSINGGSYFNYTRLAYYIGYKIVERLAEQYSMEEVFTLWVTDGFQEEMLDGLSELAKSVD